MANTAGHRQTTDGEALRIARYRRGLEVQEVVDRLTNDHQVVVTAAHLRSIERGDRNASAKLLFALAKVYRGRVDDFLIGVSGPRVA